MKARPIGSLCLILLILLNLIVPVSAAPTSTVEPVTILFTHDMHSHLLPAEDGEGNSYGGYARLKTAIDAQKDLHPNAILIDGGDFSMGSLFQAVYTTDAVELLIMGALGYDATTFGKHEYDYRALGIANMLNAAADSKEPFPSIVQANYKPPAEGDPDYDENAATVWAAYERCGIQDYTVIQRGGINFAIFGLMGEDSDACAPMSGMVFQDPADTARRIVAEIQTQVSEPRVVICLSHSGTNKDPKKSEDEKLAAEVDGIDVIVSGHSHTTLEEPIQVNDTYIVSAGEYCQNMGVLTLDLSGGNCSLHSYSLIPINDSLAEDSGIRDKIEEYKKIVETSYLTRFSNLTFDQALAINPYQFDDLEDLKEHRESALGNLIADSYLWAVKELEGDNYIPVDFAMTANGIIRDSLPLSEVTVSDVFNILSLGSGSDQTSGYPLVSCWITGKDLKNAFEVDASVTGLMPTAQLYYSGMTFTFNPHRMLFNRVTDCAQVLEDGTTVPIEDEKLYRVVTGLYCGQMLGAVKDKSFGILNITPRDAQGNEITDLESCIIYDQYGNECKEWYALAAYLGSMGTISEDYTGPDGRKIVDNSWAPSHLLTNLNAVSWIFLAVVLVLVVLVMLVIRLSIYRRRRLRELQRTMRSKM